MTASEQFFKYPPTALRVTLRSDENWVAKARSAVVRLWERISHGDGLTWWRNGDGRNS